MTFFQCFDECKYGQTGRIAYINIKKKTIIGLFITRFCGPELTSWIQISLYLVTEPNPIYFFIQVLICYQTDANLRRNDCFILKAMAFNRHNRSNVN